MKPFTIMALTATLLVGISKQPTMAEQRNAIAHPRPPYQLAFYNRHRPSYRVASALRLHQ